MATAASTSWADDDDLPSFKSRPESEPTEVATAATDGKEENSKTGEESSSDNLTDNKYDVAVTLADLQGDPNSPLYSIKKFEDLGL